jgi:hypothetical protein
MVELRIMGSLEEVAHTVEALRAMESLATYAELDAEGVLLWSPLKVRDVSRAHRNRRDPGVRVYVDLTIGGQCQGK